MARLLRRLLLVPLLGLGHLAFGQAQPWPDPGPPSTRDLFPLNLIPLTYRPVGAVPLGRGNSRVDLQATRGNTFEFSDLIKMLFDYSTEQGRLTPDRAGATRFAQAHPDEPLLYYFDGEVQRTELHFGYGLTARTDLGVTFAWQGLSGGFLDGLIEEVHRVGFQQAGRDGMAKNQLTLFVIQKGQVVFFSQEPVRVHPEDPVLDLLQTVFENRWLTASVYGRLQVPLTHWNGFQSNWDSSVGLALQWRPGPRLVMDGGAAYLRRALRPYGPDPFFIKDQVAGHLGWEWRGWPRVRPFLVLVATSGITPPLPETKLDKLSLIHDLGVHVRMGPRTSWTFSYINNISHNENTADMELALRLTVRP